MISYKVVQTQNGLQINGSINGTNFSFNVESKESAKFTQFKSLIEAYYDEEAKDDAVLANLLGLEAKLKDLVAQKETGAYIELGNNLVQDQNGLVYLSKGSVVSTVPLPTKLLDLMARAEEVGESISPIIKFWISLLRNPNIRDKDTNYAIKFSNAVVDYVTKTHVCSILKEHHMEVNGYNEEIATQYATISQTPFTREGLIQAKKVVAVETEKMLYRFSYDQETGEVKQVLRTDIEGVGTEFDEETGEVKTNTPTYSEDWIFSPYIYKNGDEFYTENKLGYIYQVGKVSRLPDWSFVNCNLNASCVRGLHVGNQDYINSYENNANITLDCLVSPMHIGAISDGENVMRVLEFYPIGIKNRLISNRHLYSSHKYAQMNEEYWAGALKEAIEKFDVAQKAIEDKKSEVLAF